MDIDVLYTWRCKSCGEELRSFGDKQVAERNRLNQKIKSHKCNPVLYKLVKEVLGKKELHSLKVHGKFVNSGDSIDNVAEGLGITTNLASDILDEMEKRELIESSSA